MEKLRAYAISVPISLESWLVSFAGIVLIRAFLEQFAYFEIERFPLIDLPTIIHYGIFFLAALTGIMAILAAFAKTGLREISVISLFGFFVIWVSPVIDLVFGRDGNDLITYIFATGPNLLLRFVTFFGGHIGSGITPGTQVELLLAVGLCCTYVYLVRRKIFPTICAGLAVYCLLFLLGAMPSLMAMSAEGPADPTAKIVQLIISSQIIPNNIHPSFSATSTGLVDLGFNKIMTGGTAIVALLGAMVLFSLVAPKKLLALVRNSRPERLSFLFLLFFFGSSLIFTSWPTNWIDIAIYFWALISLLCAWMFSVLQNDIHDKDIDVVSNPDRPFASNALSLYDMQIISKALLLLAFIFAFASGSYTLFFISIFLLVHYIYSNPPLRLKRFVFINSFLGSLVCLSVILAGFFMISPEKSFGAFPFGLVLFLIVFFTTATNVCDIKDMEGDRKGKIKTLPVILGAKKAKWLIAGTTGLLFLFVPWYFHLKVLVIPSVLVGILSWYFITKKSYREWQVFLIYILYLIFITWVLIVT